MAAISELKKYFRYQDGRLFWKDELHCKSATTRYAGKMAGDKKKNGYWYVGFRGERLLQHRIIFAIHHGYWPEEVDHIDGNPDNNKIENLRGANSAINSRNLKKRSDNSTGYSGISRLPYGSWRDRISATHVGCYKTKKEAIHARSTYLSENGYTEDQGVRH